MFLFSHRGDVLNLFRITATKIDVRHQNGLVEGELENQVLVEILFTIRQAGPGCSKGL